MFAGIVSSVDGNAIGPATVAANPGLVTDALIQSIKLFFIGNQQLETTGRAGNVIVAVESMVGPLLVALLIFVLGRRASR